MNFSLKRRTFIRGKGKYLVSSGYYCINLHYFEDYSIKKGPFYKLFSKLKLYLCR